MKARRGRYPLPSLLLLLLHSALHSVPLNSHFGPLKRVFVAGWDLLLLHLLVSRENGVDQKPAGLLLRLQTGLTFPADVGI